MVFHNNPTPWVVLGLVMMVGCVGVGMMAGQVGPFNNDNLAAKVAITQTQASLNSSATQFVYSVIQTQQAPIYQQTQIVAEMTTAPLVNTATSAAEYNLLQFSSANATQTAILSNVQNDQLFNAATQTAINNQLELQKLEGAATTTAIVQNQLMAKSTNLSINLAILLTTVTISIWIVISMANKIRETKIKGLEAHTRLLAEQRELANLRIKVQTMKKRHENQHPIPLSLMKKRPNSSKNLPRAE